MSRRPRRRASDIARTGGRNHLFFLILIGVGLAFVLFFRASMSDSSSQIFQAVVGNPELDLPRSVTDRIGDGTKRARTDAGDHTQNSSQSPHDGGT
ncbi:MAG: hypothetical protein VYA30_11660 [Myxococcota bacterium]|nr:hypothetical protein [Myxococcota bacterium]